MWEQNGDALPLSAFLKLHSTDLDEVHAHMSGVFCDHDLDLGGGLPPINFRHNQTQLRSLTFNATDYGNPYGEIIVNIPPVEELYLVQFSLAGRAEISMNNETFVQRAGEICVLETQAPIRQAFDAEYKHFTIKIPKTNLENSLVRELGFRPGDLHFSPHPVRLVGAAASFAHLVQTICNDIDQGLPGYNHPRACEAVEETLNRLLLIAVPHNHSELFNGPVSCPAPFYVRRVEQYVHAHAEEPITLNDLVEVAGVSARSLHAGFRRFRGTTPMGYLKNHRLALAHALLKNGAGSGTSVTNVALACGFTHLSKFARDYLERYGERPSETLRSS